MLSKNYRIYFETFCIKCDLIYFDSNFIDYWISHVSYGFQHRARNKPAAGQRRDSRRSSSENGGRAVTTAVQTDNFNGLIYTPQRLSSRKSGCCRRVNSMAKPFSRCLTTRPWTWPRVTTAPIGGRCSVEMP